MVNWYLYECRPSVRCRLKDIPDYSITLDNRRASLSRFRKVSKSLKLSTLASARSKLTFSLLDQWGLCCIVVPSRESTDVHNNSKSSSLRRSIKTTFPFLVIGICNFRKKIDFRWALPCCDRTEGFAHRCDACPRPCTDGLPAPSFLRRHEVISSSSRSTGISRLFCAAP